MSSLPRYSFSWQETTGERYDTDRARRITAAVTDNGLEIAQSHGGVNFTIDEPRGDATLVVVCNRTEASELANVLEGVVGHPVTVKKETA